MTLAGSLFRRFAPYNSSQSTTHKRAVRLVFFMRGGAEELVATVACVCTQQEVGAAVQVRLVVITSSPRLSPHGENSPQNGGRLIVSLCRTEQRRLRARYSVAIAPYNSFQSVTNKRAERLVFFCVVEPKICFCRLSYLI